MTRLLSPLPHHLRGAFHAQPHDRGISIASPAYERRGATPDGSKHAKLSGNVLGATCHGVHTLAYLNNPLRRPVRPVDAFPAHRGSVSLVPRKRHRRDASGPGAAESPKSAVFGHCVVRVEGLTVQSPGWQPTSYCKNWPFLGPIQQAKNRDGKSGFFTRAEPAAPAPPRLGSVASATTP